eukprot:TRINITY_DN1780_c0_g1_i2.p1 TRINITY_DN1780_c0_g1~~TRINITY_DN1780_c0_g1_i2.p1  ORF type:complete len:501 (+),score=121.38 TRINITY_DN1780_c0_g1_i2:48-1505(+)
MTSIPVSREDLARTLFATKVVTFGTFTLKSGIVSPVYFDLRVTVSFPHALKGIAKHLLQLMEQEQDGAFDFLCGVPYTALPFATLMSDLSGIGMVMRRKEAKSYGTKKLIEGVFTGGENVLVVEDVVTSGASVLETVQVLRQAGLTITHAYTLLDRQQGGAAMLAQHGITLRSVFRVSELVEILSQAQLLQEDQARRVLDFVKTPAPAPKDKVVLSYQQRSQSPGCHPLSKRIFDIMESKKSNLCISVDTETMEQALTLIEQTGPYVCMVKTHVDIWPDFTQDKVQMLTTLAEKHNFVLFEDRKFADIGNTVQLQCRAGVYRIASWADLVNAHALPGPGILTGLASCAQPADPSARLSGCLLLAQMSSEGTLARGDYTTQCKAMAAGSKDFVMGYICMERISDDPGHLHITPGVKLPPPDATSDGKASGGDGLGQQYNTPEVVIAEKGNDIIVVGRGIYQAADPVQEARRYQEAGWAAYQKKLQP